MLKVSVILRARNEYPVILGTIHSFLEDLEFHGYTPEFIVVDNKSTDDMADVLEDKFRRWVRCGLLKVVRYYEKPSTWCAINAGYAEATGDVIIVADAHISVKVGTLDLIIKGALERGGLWHVPLQMWGDLTRIKRYQHDVRLTEKFWGDPCQFIPEGCSDKEPYQIAMAGAFCFAVRRDEIEKFGLYDQSFGPYGGGEPYLTLKWWMMGSAVWMEPRGLARHAFGIDHVWAEAKKDKKTRNQVYLEDGRITNQIRKGEKYLSYKAGYTVDNRDFYRNFLIASYLIGGTEWLEHMASQFSPKFKVRNDLLALVEEVRLECAPSRKQIAAAIKIPLNDLLMNPPWNECHRHNVKLPRFLNEDKPSI